MAEETEDNSKVNDNPIPNPPPKSNQFIEILCICSGKTHRFASGTKAGFALNFMNNKLLQIEAESKTHLPLSSYIESGKEGEEPIVFGPTATLQDFGHGWKLVTVTHSGVLERKGVDKGLFGDSDLKVRKSSQEISVVYIGKILVSFVVIFLFAALCTLFLENLPELILYIRQFT